MRKHICSIFILFSLLIVLNGCQLQTFSSKNEISRELGVDVSKGEQLAYTDSHGGFHGDGQTFAALKFPDDTLLNEIASSHDWHPLPLSENLTAAVYGISDGNSSVGPYLKDEEGEPVIPEIQNGYYFFLDRHSESRDSHDDRELFQRFSFNFTIALYDVDTDTLYYVKLDT